MNKRSAMVRNGAFLLKQFWGETLLCFQQQQKYNARSEYVEIANSSEISNGIYKIDDVCN